MSKLLAVVGATGNQGSSVITAILNDTSLSRQYKIRAVTRNVTSAKAPGPLLPRHPLTNVHTISLMSTPASGPNAAEQEFHTIKVTADIAVAQGVQYIIFSTLPSPEQKSTFALFQYKARFNCPGSFMQNFLDLGMAGVRKWEEDGGKWVMERHVSKETKLPLINAVGDTGKFVAAILVEPERFSGKVVRAVAREYSHEEIVGCLSRVTGKEIAYRQVRLRGAIEEMAGWEALVVEYFGYLEKFGYFGPAQEESVERSVANVKGKLSTFKEYLEAHPVRLE
ncbi:Putative NmrA-like domain, NAD(P)-binding domain superfamily [Septoria linicola]|uniref:NmrA-like domain, NAD(P)-binding domain superfamily n=1 Tax=Septoria linicola TaxID=215465 RepID=A0A9Q9AW27_9PEZI|nr:putative NmrA-like domain, NAD(P)-binding domain superfamily [Septoria linicola]USW55974.1 Putative NmrA-like domain, NAD(P)-binding domain superfamily [Septoria linicola]